jgi:hypothetical protein
MDGSFSPKHRTGGHQEGRLIVLGIETSCDETAAAISQDGRILSSQVSTQTIHRKYGGVVPEIASREHEKLFLALMIDRLHRDGLDPEKYLNKMLRAHLNRGVYSLVARIHSLSAINEMIKAEMKY